LLEGHTDFLSELTLRQRQFQPPHANPLADENINGVLHQNDSLTDACK
jgi:hypothetical protein